MGGFVFTTPTKKGPTAGWRPTAITLDLLEEIFSPEKIIIYNPHRWWPTGADTIEKDATGDLTRGLMADSCNAPHSLAKYRDAHLCAAYSPARARVRRAWVDEFAFAAIQPTTGRGAPLQPERQTPA